MHCNIINVNRSFNCLLRVKILQNVDGTINIYLQCIYARNLINTFMIIFMIISIYLFNLKKIKKF